MSTSTLQDLGRCWVEAGSEEPDLLRCHFKTELFPDNPDSVFSDVFSKVSYESTTQCGSVSAGSVQWEDALEAEANEASILLHTLSASDDECDGTPYPLRVSLSYENIMIGFPMVRFTTTVEGPDAEFAPQEPIAFGPIMIFSELVTVEEVRAVVPEQEVRLPAGWTNEKGEATLTLPSDAYTFSSFNAPDEFFFHVYGALGEEAVVNVELNPVGAEPYSATLVGDNFYLLTDEDGLEAF